LTYIFDTNSLSRLKHFFPGVFKSIWEGLDGLVVAGELISTREVWRELQLGNPNETVNIWLNERKNKIFTMPDSNELEFVAKILSVRHFQTLIGEKQRLKGTPVADPFIIACAKIRGGVVVTEERAKDNSAKIPNVCEYFEIECIDLEQFMARQGWSF
jgi:hypothetical protein